jgi:uncharacterized membrane protein YsdA (DUF1294 family)
MRRRRLTGFSWIVLAGLLVLPICALGILAQSVHWAVPAGWALLISLGTFATYGIDKRRAESGEWRIPELNLHLAEFLGGWPGAFVAQRWFNHKTSKISYRIVYWLIVLLHELIAIDCLNSWRCAAYLYTSFRNVIS